MVFLKPGVRIPRLFPFAFLCLAFVGGCSPGGGEAANVSEKKENERVMSLTRQRNAVVRFFQPMKVIEGDWLDTQREPGETFEEYLAGTPTLPINERKTIYIQPIGKFSTEQQQAIELTAEYMKAYYNLPVKLNAVQPLGNVPNDKKRLMQYRNNLQIRTSYFLDDVLPTMLPEDAAAFIAFTNYDLYPEPTWAFVFGQASLERRVGVWSLYRFADPKTGKYEPTTLLTRTLKIAMHETGHMFGMRHCTKYECLMAGTNHLLETDRRPLDNCPECMAKLSWAMNYDPAERYRRLAAFWKDRGSPDEEKQMLAKAKAVANVN